MLVNCMYLKPSELMRNGSCFPRPIVLLLLALDGLSYTQ